MSLSRSCHQASNFPAKSFHAQIIDPNQILVKPNFDKKVFELKQKGDVYFNKWAGALLAVHENVLKIRTWKRGFTSIKVLLQNAGWHLNGGWLHGKIFWWKAATCVICIGYNEGMFKPDA